MENFVTFVIVGLVACSGLTFAGDPAVDCMAEKNSFDLMRDTFMNSMEGFPTCWKKFAEEFENADWDSINEAHANAMACWQGLNWENFEETIQNCMAADWGCMVKAWENMRGIFERIKPKDVKECFHEMKKAAHQWRNDNQDTFLDGLKAMKEGFSETCKNSLIEFGQEKMNGYGVCTCNE